VDDSDHQLLVHSVQLPLEEHHQMLEMHYQNQPLELLLGEQEQALLVPYM
jgi:hypothetical protein